MQGPVPFLGIWEPGVVSPPSCGGKATLKINLLPRSQESSRRGTDFTLTCGTTSAGSHPGPKAVYPSNNPLIKQLGQAGWGPLVTRSEKRAGKKKKKRNDLMESKGWGLETRGQ